MVEISQELMATLEYTAPDPGWACYELFAPGNVLRMKECRAAIRTPFSEKLLRYRLAGHVNDGGGGCDCCGIGSSDVEAVAHISQLFKEDV